MVQPELHVLIAFGVLLYASAQDLKYMEIDDLAWKSLVVAGLVFVALDTISNTGALLDFAISILVMSAILIPLERLNKIGGGDVKILLGLAIILPRNPYTRISVFPVFTLGVFTNAIFLTSAITIYFLARNLYHKDFNVESLSEVRFLFLGYKKKVSTVTEHDRVMKKMGGEAWVTPAVPFMVPLTLGFLLSIAWGDIPSYLILMPKLI
ncbi:MAG: prepilin peptidase [Candidatus Hydrothermarchaeaceae archaeon]